MDALTFQRITGCAPDVFAQVEQIYQASFPLVERAPFEWLADSISAGKSALYVCTGADTVLGFGMTTPLLQADLYFLSYFAVNGAIRSRGVGSGLFGYILGELACHGPAELIWEVETDEVSDLAWQALCRKRIGFYQKNGAVLLEAVTDYRMPVLTGEGEIPTKLMWISSDPTVRPPQGARLVDYVASIYQTVYGREKGDPLVRSILASIAA